MAKAARKTAGSKTVSEEKTVSLSAPSETGEKHNGSGLKKQYTRGQKCKVTFTLPAEAAPDAKNVMLVGEFNAWDEAATPMKKLKNGSFQATLTLDTGRDYRFRYLIDGIRWENDWQADRYEPSPFACEDSVVSI